MNLQVRSFHFLCGSLLVDLIMGIHFMVDDEDKIILLTMQEAQIFLRDLCWDVSEMGGRLSSGTTALK